MKLQLARLIKNICYAAGCASAVLSLALKSAPQTAQRCSEASPCWCWASLSA